MTVLRRARAALLLSAGLALAACGNANPELAGLVKSIPQLITSGRAAPEPIPAAQIAQALAATTNPVALYALEDRDNAQLLLLEIERNGAYQSFGNVARLLIVMRQGMITSTRGFGGDLMSSEEDALLSLVANRASGTAQYDLRFLTPEEVTEVRRFVCTTQPGGSMPVTAGFVQEGGVIVKARCEGPTGSFENTYVVSGDGYILSGRQWLGPTIGFVNSQMLRR